MAGLGAVGELATVISLVSAEGLAFARGVATAGVVATPGGLASLRDPTPAAGLLSTGGLKIAAGRFIVRGLATGVLGLVAN